MKIFANLQILLKLNDFSNVACGFQWALHECPLKTIF